MKSWELMEFHYTIKEVFGSFDILNDIESEDLPAVYQFSKIACNYIKMTEALKEENEKTS